MHKRLCLTAWMIVTLLLFTACTAPAKGQPQELNGFLLKEAVALTVDMDALAENNGYMALMPASGNVGEIIDKVAAGNYGAPQNAYFVKLTDEGLLRAITAFAGEAEISEDILEILKYKINASVFANIINAAYGSEMVAAASVLTWGKSYIAPAGWSENTMLILEYPGEFSGMVSFVQSGEGVISASSIFMKNGEKDVSALLEEYLGSAGLTYEQYDAGQVQDMLNG